MLNSKSLRLVLVAGLGAFCASCSSLGSLDPANVLSMGAGTSGSTVTSASGEIKDIDCPLVEVQDGTSAVRIGGQSNDSVRYQFDITNTARECHIQGNQFSLKVGVAGHLLIGPAGSPGAYSTQLRLAIRRDSDQKAEISKSYKIEANTSGGPQAPFQFVSEVFMLPFTHQQEDQDYTILVGFDNAHPAEAPKRRRVKHAN
jgi:hypothetical protein